MTRNRTIFLRLAGAICGLALFGAVLVPDAATAGTGQNFRAEKSTKAKSTKAKRSKKSTTVAADSQTGSASRAKAPEPVTNATPAEIQSAKSSGDVWVNTETGVYHKSGKWYGATKNGKFMPEQEAIKSGFRAAKNEK
jgi:hypothetical protein